jgi:hypothetical protein
MCGCTRFNQLAFLITTIVSLSLSCVGFALIFTMSDPSNIYHCGKNAICNNQIVLNQRCAVLNYTIGDCDIIEYKFGKLCEDIKSTVYSCYVLTDTSAGNARCIPNAELAAGIIIALVITGLLALYGLLGLIVSISFMVLSQNDCKPDY